MLINRAKQNTKFCKIEKSSQKIKKNAEIFAY